MLLDLTRSIRDWPAGKRRRAALLCFAIGLPVAVLTAVLLGYLFDQADVPQYLALAQGRPAMMPFASRQLGPLIARGLVHLFALSVDAAFLVEGTLAMLVFFATVVWYLLHSGAPRFMITATAGLLFWTWQYSSLALPDLLYAALLCVFLLLLDRGQFLLAAAMMLPLAVSRESTLLTLACFLAAGWHRLRIAHVVTALLATGAGILLVKRLSANALPNNEHISPYLYLFAKMPWAFVKNFLGIYPWSNVYPECATPVWQMRVHLGPVHAIGSCGFIFNPVQQLIFYGLASFGLFPLLLLAIRRSIPSARAFPPLDSVFLRFCLIYGIVSFALAGVLGESFQRLFAYSWPLFLIALPILLAASRISFRSNRAAVLFLILHLMLSWTALYRFNPALLPYQIVLWIAGYLLLRRTLIPLPGAS